MGVSYIGIEQLELHAEKSVLRLEDVIHGDASGISAEVNWQGGGSFVYCELAKLNQKYADSIRSAQDDTALASVYRELLNTGFISSNVNPKKIDPQADDFMTLSADDKKQLLLELLDVNQLYVNYCDIDDETYAISKEDKAFTKSFYGEV